MDELRRNRVAYPDHIVWQGTRIRWIAYNALAAVVFFGAAAPAFLAAAGDSGAARTRLRVVGWVLAAAGLLFAAGCLRYCRIQARRRIEIRPDAVVLVDGRRAVPIAWDTIASVWLGCRLSVRTDRATASLNLTLHNGDIEYRSLAYVEEGMLRALAVDVCEGLAGRQVRFTVKGPQVVADEVVTRMARGRQPRSFEP
ncbi:hypothetical protein ACPA54_09165 [Uniformispora flossi]|uniref:hypothetical protein n=1 Tax=Uniformispora flossi TaxID=3390723 RepID=UPI003C2CD471